MDKYLKKLDPKALLGRKIYSDEDEEYVIEYAKIDKKQGCLLIYFANEKDAQKDEEHKKGLRELKKELAKDNIDFDEYKGNIWKVRYARVRVYNALLTANEEKQDIDCYIRSDNDSFYIYNGDGYDEDVTYAEILRQQLYERTGIVGGLRGIFKDIFGQEYMDELKKHYISIAKKNVRDAIRKEKQEIEFARKRLKDLQKDEKEIYIEEGIKVFEDVGEDEEELDNIYGDDYDDEEDDYENE